MQHHYIMFVHFDLQAAFFLKFLHVACPVWDSKCVLT